MKLSKQTVDILKNFSSINNGIEFKANSPLRTISPSKTILTEADIPEQFPEDFCVYDLNQFLSVMGLHKDPEINFDTANIIFQSGKNKTKYRKTAKSMIVTPPVTAINLPSIDVSFQLPQETLHSILDSAKILQSPHIAVQASDGTISIVAYNSSDDSAHINAIEIDSESKWNGNDFRIVFLTENLKMMPGTYDVEISFGGLATFTNIQPEYPKYWIATEMKENRI